MTRSFENESGYSMVEVLAAIVILSLTILPMVGMFDAGLRAASTSGNYDTARALANTNLEIAKNKDFSAVAGQTSCWREQDASLNDCEVSTDYVQLKEASSSGTMRFEDSGEPTDMLKVTVSVEWDGKEYRTSGIVAE